MQLHGARLARRGGDQHRHRHAHRLGARARRVPRQAPRQRNHRSAVRAAHDRGRAHAARPLRPEGPGAVRHRVHAARRSRSRCCSSRCRSSCARSSRCSSSSTATWRRRRPRSAPGRARSSARIVLPNLVPAILAGAGLAFARALGEFGSVVLISGNIPFKTEVASVFLFGQIESDNTDAAAAVERRAAGALLRAAARRELRCDAGAAPCRMSRALAADAAPPGARLPRRAAGHPRRRWSSTAPSRAGSGPPGRR